ncbi:hypothetical protein HDG34_007939 [Paraburkholderia sp. HC6.4b]|nr:hypothetical protein [Paraburkholderia sp. HC6.4b]MBB5456354.1 hypothetical protein [Paraburkholderia sp. Kb1A]
MPEVFRRCSSKITHFEFGFRESLGPTSVMGRWRVHIEDQKKHNNAGEPTYTLTHPSEVHA